MKDGQEIRDRRNKELLIEKTSLSDDEKEDLK